MSRSDYTGPVLLGFYYYRALDFYPFHRFIAFGPWAPIYRLSYLIFRTFGLCHTLYFECYRYWAFKPCDTILTFIFINGDFINYYLSNCFYYFESDGCHNFFLYLSNKLRFYSKHTHSFLKTMALLMTIILGLILGWLAFVVGLLIGWAWRPRWVSSPSEEKVQSQCSAPRSFELSSPSSPSPLKGFGSAPCFKTLVCGTWNMALRQQKTISPVSSSEQVHVLDGGKKTEERLPNTVTELDLRNLVQLVERKDGGLPWIQMMDQFIPGMRYQAWLREPKNGPTEYRSRTVFEDATPEVVRDFFWDDEFRPTWDTMLASSTTVEECTSTGTMIVRWIRKFPFFCSDREYVIGRRIWNCGKSYYCVTKGVSVPCIPRNNKQKRVDLFYSSWCIRPVESRSDDGVTSACEVLLFHHEDMGIPKEIAKLGVKRGMWGAVKKMEPGLRAYQEQRLSREGGFKLSRPAFMAQINTKITSEHLVSLSNGATSEAEAPETEAPVTLDRGNGAENLKKLLFIGGAVAVACTLSGGGFVPPAVLLGFGKRFGGRKREPQGTATTTTRSQSQTTSS